MIKILSLYYENFNYGGMLQAYALSTFLINKGYNATQISYKRNYKRPSLIQRIVRLTPSKLTSRILGAFCFTKRKCVRREKFVLFQNSFIPHTDKLYDSSNISRVVESGDIFIVGSDQVWNPDWTEDVFYLDFAPNNKKISYAASFGVSQVSSTYANHIRNLLKAFDSISVRELTAKQILNDIIDKSVQVVLDPTMLLTYEDWDQIATNDLKIDYPYAFVYLLGDQVELRLKAKKIAKEFGLKILFIPHVHLYYNINDVDYGDICLSNVGPNEFIEIVKKASLVITDSFHGCVFSILFKKEFWVLNRQKEEESGNTQSRITSLIQILGLPEREVSAIKGNLKAQEKINYDMVSIKLEELRSKSSEWLQKAINS